METSTVSPEYHQVLDTLAESLRSQRRTAFLLQLSQAEPQPQELSLPQLMAEIV